MNHNIPNKHKKSYDIGDSSKIDLFRVASVTTKVSHFVENDILTRMNLHPFTTSGLLSFSHHI